MGVTTAGSVTFTISGMRAFLTHPVAMLGNRVDIIECVRIKMLPRLTMVASTLLQMIEMRNPHRQSKMRDLDH